MDVSIAVPSPRVHSDTATTASATPSAAISLPSTTPPANSMDTGQTTLVHARLDARDVMAGSCDSGQEDEELEDDSHHNSSHSPSTNLPSKTSAGDDEEEEDDDD